jgi:RNA polymerase sigma-70 factor (sigma-E family)
MTSLPGRPGNRLHSRLQSRGFTTLAQPLRAGTAHKSRPEGCNRLPPRGVLRGVGSVQKHDRSGRLDAGFEQFVAATSPQLLRSAYLLLGDRDDAEDLLQTALIRTLRRWDAISGSPAAYAFAVLVNLSRDHKRALRRRPLIEQPADVPDRASHDSVKSLLERDAVIQAALRLGHAQREALACRFLLDLSVAETAATLGVPEGTVKSHTARALAAMRELLADEPIPARGGSSEVRDVD